MKLKLFFTVLIFLQLSSAPVMAATDPREVPNNVMGINSLSPEAELGEVANLVNANGDWGYIVVVIKKDERDVRRWQNFLNQLRNYKLIPIMRIATGFDSQGFWQKPAENDAKEWADFFSKLHFPTKNRYIQAYNEVNVAGEWGGKVDASDYARELDKTISALKEKSDDFFVINSPLDLSRITTSTSVEAYEFFRQMESAVPGIFNKLDGWGSHSYPNPAFSAAPYESGKIKIDGFDWELNQISQYSSGKELPVFITETGWKRGQGGSGLNEDEIAAYYKSAFANIWNDRRIAAVAPFVFSYPEPLFNEFSFKNGSDSYYKYFHELRDLPKVKGEPRRDNLISGVELKRPEFILKDTEGEISIKFKNVGNYVWNTQKGLAIKTFSTISSDKILWNKQEVYPGEEVRAKIKIKSGLEGKIPLKIQIKDGEKILAESEIIVITQTPFSIFIAKIRSFMQREVYAKIG